MSKGAPPPPPGPDPVTRRAAEAFETRAIALQAQATAMAAEPHPAPLLARHEVLMLISTEFRRIAEELIPGGLSWEPLDGARPLAGTARLPAQVRALRTGTRCSALPGTEK